MAKKTWRSLVYLANKYSKSSNLISVLTSSYDIEYIAIKKDNKYLCFNDRGSFYIQEQLNTEFILDKLDFNSLYNILYITIKRYIKEK